MSGNHRQLELRFFVLVGRSYSGPINFSLRYHHKPIDITSPGFLTVFGLSPDQVKGQLRIYHLGKRRFLDQHLTYEGQEVGPLDIVALTDETDTEMLEAFLCHFIKEKESNTGKPPRINPNKFDSILEDL